jgi:hypothetical protein
MKNIKKILISIALISCLSLGVVGCQKTGDGGIEDTSESVADNANVDDDGLADADADADGDDQQDADSSDADADADAEEEYVTVTDADGNAVTDNDGNPVTAKVVKSDSDDSSDVSIQVVNVTDANGNDVTDSNGDVVTETQVVQVNGNNSSNGNGNSNNNASNGDTTDANGNAVTTTATNSNGNSGATTTTNGNSNNAENNATTTLEDTSVYFAKNRYTTFLWMSDDTSNYYQSGAMAELTFKVLDDAKVGTTYPIEFNFVEIYDTDAVEVPFTVQNGSIEVGKDLSVTQQGAATSGVNYRMDKATAQPGDTVTLTVYLDNNSGMAITSVELKYDNNALEMQSVKATGAFADQVIESNMNSENTRKQ